MITIDTPLEYVVTAGLGLWLAASILSAIGVRAFSTPPLVVLRLFMSWRLFAGPEGFFHTLEYLDTTGEGATWVVAASTRSHLHLPFVLSRAALMADHLDYTTFHLDKALRRRRSAGLNSSLLAAIEANLSRHPAIRVLGHGRPVRLRVMRRRAGILHARDQVVREWTPTRHD